MAKKIDDIIPSGKKSIRSIPISIRRVENVAHREVAPSPKTRTPEPVAVASPLKEEPRHVRPSKSGKKYVYLASIFGVLIIIFALLAVFDGATLSYTPKVSNLNFADKLYNAYQTPKEEGPTFSVVKISVDKSTNVSASGEENVSEKAKGMVVIYNEQSSAQTLVNTTRLESPDGKIYRIQKEISIPAKGSLEVEVVADQAGESYNIGLTDFTIPGLKGTARYDVVYARSKSTMTGGFIGTRKKVSDADLASARANLEAILRTELTAQARAQTPVEFVLFPELSQVSFELLPVEAAGGSQAKVTLRGHLNAALFKRSDISNFLTKAELGASSSPAEILDFSKMNIILANPKPADLAKAESIRIQVTGSAVARYQTDKVALASDLAGLRKDSVENILKEYPSIESAEVSIRPFWKSTFPIETSKIKIEATDE